MSSAPDSSPSIGIQYANIADLESSLLFALKSHRESKSELPAFQRVAPTHYFLGGLLNDYQALIQSNSSSPYEFASQLIALADSQFYTLIPDRSGNLVQISTLHEHSSSVAENLGNFLTHYCWNTSNGERFADRLNKYRIPLDQQEIFYMHDALKASQTIYNSLVLGRGAPSRKAQIDHVTGYAAMVDIYSKPLTGRENFRDLYIRYLALGMFMHHFYCNKNPYPLTSLELPIFSAFSKKEIETIYECANYIKQQPDLRSIEMKITELLRSGNLHKAAILKTQLVVMMASVVDSKTSMEEPRSYRPKPFEVAESLREVARMIYEAQLPKDMVELIYNSSSITLERERIVGERLAYAAD